MFSFLSGAVLFKKQNHLVLDTGGVGYKVHCTPRTLDALREGERCGMHTHLVVREDALEIFGFLSEEELELFKLLISVSGIGPRSALGVLALDAPEKLVHAIGKGDVGYLTKVSGVGKKSAEKIVLEIRDKVSLLSFDDTPISGGEEETLEVLLALGYRREEAREALRAISSDLETRDERIKEALKLLSVRL